jgi:hypothetical protein
MDRRCFLSATLLTPLAMTHPLASAKSDARRILPASPSPAQAGPTGNLVYRNSMVGIFRFASGDELTFEPATFPEAKSGVAVSRQGLISVSLESGWDSVALGFYDLAGGLQTTVEVMRPSLYAFQLGAARFNADGTLLAVPVDELVSASSMARITRTLVYDWPTDTPRALIDGFEEPCWAVNELLVRHPETMAVHRLDAQFKDQGALPGLVVSQYYGGWDVSHDGRFIATVEDAATVKVYDRQAATSYQAVHDPQSGIIAVTFSPDGRHLALLSRFLQFTVPFVVPFDGASTAILDNALAIGDTLVDVGGRIGWAV